MTHCLELLLEIRRFCKMIKFSDAHYIADGLTSFCEFLGQEYQIEIKPVQRKKEEGFNIVKFAEGILKGGI